MAIVARSLCWCFVFVSTSVCIFGKDTTTLDSTYFPEVQFDTAHLVVVQGNWPEDHDINDKKAWLPVRLFGKTEADKLVLDFTTRATTAQAKSSLEVWTRSKQKEEDIPVVFNAQPIPSATLNPNPAATVSSSPSATPSATPLRFQAKTANVNGKRVWWWEGFIAVKSEILDDAHKKAPFLIDLTVRDGKEEEEARFCLALGESWLIAGRPIVSASRPAGDQSLDGVTVVSASGDTCVLFPKQMLDALPQLKIPLAMANAPSCLGAEFASYLSSNFEGKDFGARPVVVHTYSKSRKLITEWSKEKALGPAWDGLLKKGESDLLLPGFRGVIWWHGEWDAEYGAFDRPLDEFDYQTSNKLEINYSLDLKKFYDSYVKLGRSLRDNLTKRLAMLEKSDPSIDDRISQHILWVLVQAPGAGRKSEFFDVFEPAPTPTPPTNSPQSSWAVLRAAQFTIAEQIRNNIWLGKPVAMTVPMQGVSGSKPQWLWTPETDLSLFEAAASRLAHEVFVSQTQPPVTKQDDTNRFADGWPHLTWSDPPKLTFPNVQEIALLHLPSTEGAHDPRLECATKEPWAANTVWKSVDFPDQNGLPINLPKGTIAVRYAWADASTGLHDRKRGNGNTGAIEESPLPSFLLIKP